MNPFADMFASAVGGLGGESFAEMNPLQRIQALGRSSLQRYYGMQPDDTAEKRLRALQAIEALRRMRMENTALAPFAGDPAKVFSPGVKRELLETGEYDPNTDEPIYAPLEEHTYTPEQRLAARLVFGVNLPESADPLKKFQMLDLFRQRKEGRTQRTQQMADTATHRRTIEEEARARTDIARQNAALASAAHEDRKLASEERQNAKNIEVRLRKEAAHNTIIRHAQENEYPIELINEAAQEAIDENGILDSLKMYRIMAKKGNIKGKTPKALRIEREHQARIAIANKRIESANATASRLKDQYGDTQGYRKYLAASKRWRQEFDAFTADLNNIGKPFPTEPPDPEMYIGQGQPTSAAPKTVDYDSIINGTSIPRK